MSPSATLLALLASALLLNACARYRVVVPEPTPATEYESKRLDAYLWGALEETASAENCVDNALDEVRAKQTFPQVLATVLTLGIWMPLEMEWRCAKRPQQQGSGF